jgi:hypothetical protein
MYAKARRAFGERQAQSRAPYAAIKSPEASPFSSRWHTPHTEPERIAQLEQAAGAAWGLPVVQISAGPWHAVVKAQMKTPIWCCPKRPFC